MLMSHATGKFIAMILAIWLPLFSGNALAASVAMQSMAGDSHSAVMSQGEHQSHCASAMQQHTNHDQHDNNLLQATYAQQDTESGDCGTCHLACCGYMATASMKVIDDRLPAQLFPSVSTQFQSITPAPLDPPPLARI